MLEESSRLGSYHFTRGAGGQLIARTPVRQENGARGVYFHLDGGGNVVALTGENGNLLGDYRYDAFGNMLAKPRNPMLDSFTFAGNAYEMRTGLYNFHARWYDPALGRFLTRDPAPGFAVMPQTLNP